VLRRRGAAGDAAGSRISGGDLEGSDPSGRWLAVSRSRGRRTGSDRPRPGPCRRCREA
jgi:hypothetical protein